MKKLMNLLFCLISTCVYAESASTEDLNLWGTSVSPYVRKVVNVLKYKDINYVQHDILPKILLEATNQGVPAEFIKASPLGKIPALQTNSGSISDSAVIIAYLEKRFPDKAVYPQSPQLLADVLWIEKYSDTVITDVIHTIFLEKVIYPKILNKSPNIELVNKLCSEDLPRVLSYLNKQVVKHLFMVGDHLSLADFAVANHLVDLDASKIEWKNSYPELAAYYDRMLSIEVFSSSIPEMLK